MKAIKDCYWWKRWWKHHFEIVGEIKHLKIKGINRAGMYERRCIHCGLYQKISCAEGMHFLDEETGGK